MKSFKIKYGKANLDEPTFIIAEIDVNDDGSL